jgi:hypothetical protein
MQQRGAFARDVRRWRGIVRTRCGWLWPLRPVLPEQRQADAGSCRSTAMPVPGSPEAPPRIIPALVCGAPA